MPALRRLSNLPIWSISQGNSKPGHTNLQLPAFALLIGGMKCGTTSLFELLSQHPEVCGSRVKEPDFFTRDRTAEEWEEYLELWDWNSQVHEVAIEASTAYTKHPWVEGVPERIAAARGRFRFIYMVRDPVRRIQSQVRHGLYGGWGKSLDDELTADLIDFSRYAMQLDRYTALFPQDDILVLTLEELKRDPAGVLRRTCLFLDINPDHEFQGAREARNTGDLYTAPSLVTAFARNRPLKRMVDLVLPRPLRHRLRSWVARSGSGSDRAIGRWQLTESEARHVQRRLADDMHRLHSEYGVEAAWLPPRRDTPTSESR